MWCVVRMLVVPPAVVDPESLRRWEPTRGATDPPPVEKFPPIGGVLLTESLCLAVLGPPADRADGSAPSHVEFLGGPPDPMVDGGTVLYRLPGEFVRRLAAADGLRDAEHLARWRTELLNYREIAFFERFLRTQSLPELTYATFQDAACRATDLGWNVCLAFEYP